MRKVLLVVARLLVVPLVAAVVVVGGVTPAVAEPGSPPFALGAPADGATVPADPDGIVVRFTCPTYDSGQGTRGPSDYTVRFSRDPATDSAGFLPGRWTSGATPVGDGTCTGLLRSAYDFEQDQPEEAGGVFYWQVTRFCVCPPDNRDQRSAVGRFTVDPGTPSLKLKAPRRAYPGLYTEVTLVNRSGVKAPAVLLEVAKGKGWRELDRQPLAADRNTFLVRLPKGDRRVRATVLGYAGTTSTKARKVVVAPGGRRVTGPADDGAYEEARDPDGTVKMTVRKDGTLVEPLRVSVVATCVGSSVGDVTAQVFVAVFDKIKVAPTGSVIDVVTGSDPDDSTEWSVVGRLRNRTFTGTVDLQVVNCFGDRDLELVRS